MDKNQDGTLSKEELLECYQEYYDPMIDEAYIDNILESIDINNSGRIDFTEFLVASSKQEKLLSKEKLEKTFKMFDIVNEGVCMI